jgi:hypothetical protein
MGSTTMRKSIVMKSAKITRSAQPAFIFTETRGIPAGIAPTVTTHAMKTLMPSTTRAT